MTALGDMVRSADRDRYASVLYAPDDRREALFALYAFNIEIARIRDIASDPMVGELRLQWWHDAVAGCTGTETAGHPVADALRSAIDEHRLPVAALTNMIEARRFDLYDDAMPSRTDLEGYCGETAGALIQLASLVLDSGAAMGHGGAAGHAGCAQAIAGLLSLLPIHRRRGQTYIPADLIAAAGADVADLRADTPGEPAMRAVAAMVALGREHFSAFLTHARDIPASLRPAYLAAAAAGARLDAIEQAGPAVFDQPVVLSPLRQNAIALRRALFGWR
ncbi:MAG: phytoene/squalene synthase family protein [Rhizobiaceae bacterium]